MLWKSKKVLVTGGAGFIGSNLAIKLHELGADVEVVDNFSPFCGSNPFNLHAIEKKIPIHRMDICKEPIDTIVREKEFIFHLAGQTGHHFGQQRPEVDMEINVHSALKVLESVRKTNPQAKVLYTSTRQIYGEPQYLPVDEKHPLRPPDINGIHKAAAEEYFRIYHHVYGTKTCSFRLTNTYGPRQTIKNNQYGVVGWFLNRALLNETVTVASGSEQIRDFSFVDDVTDALTKAAMTDVVWGEVYNISGERASLRTLAELIIEAARKGKLGEITFTEEEKKIQLKDYYATGAKLEAAIGWKPQNDLKLGLQKTLSYFSTHLEHYIPGGAH